MADFCVTLILAGFITFALFYLLSWMNEKSVKVIKKIRGKANEPIECQISSIVS
jgi:predicted PurR-regulated permease PerM